MITEKDVRILDWFLCCNFDYHVCSLVHCLCYVLYRVVFSWLVAYAGKSAANGRGQDAQSAGRTDSSVVKIDSEVRTEGGVAEPVGEWLEATSPEGYVYYWNTVTKGAAFWLSAFAYLP